MDFTSNNLYINLIFKNQLFKKIHNMFLNNASRIYDKKYEEDKNRSFKVSTIRKKEKEEKSHWLITKLKTITIVNARPFNRIIPYNVDSRACIITNSTLFFFFPTDNGLTSTYPSRRLPLFPLSLPPSVLFPISASASWLVSSRARSRGYVDRWEYIRLFAWDRPWQRNSAAVQSPLSIVPP